MPDIVIMYDLQKGDPSPHGAFMAAAREGLLYVWKGATYVNRLLNTTVWGVFSDREAANNAFDKALAAAEKTVGYTIKLEKRMTIEEANTLVNSDKRKVPESKWTGTTAFESLRLQLNDPFFKYLKRCAT